MSVACSSSNRRVMSVLLLTIALFQFHVRGVSAGVHSFFANHVRTLALKKPHLFNGTKAAFLHRLKEISAASSTKNAHVYSDSEQLPSTKAFEAMAERRSLGQVSEMYTCTHVSDDDNWGCNEPVKTVENLENADAQVVKDHFDGCFPGGWDAYKSRNLKVECTGDPCITSLSGSEAYCIWQYLWGQANTDELIKCSSNLWVPSNFEWAKAAHHIPESCTMDTDKILVEEKIECGSDDKISRYSLRYKMVDGSKIRSCKETTNCKSLTESIDYVRCETVDPPSPPPTTTPRVVINYSGAGSSVARSWFAMLTCAAIAFLLGFS